jgi:hypothetical protein
LERRGRAPDGEAMASQLLIGSRRRAVLLLASALLAGCVPLVTPTSSSAAVITFGSPLAGPATLDTANNLAYSGSNVQLPGSVFHVNHDGADTVLWNTAQVAPSAGQITSVKLEGCAKQPSGAPPPLTQFHFQDLVPTADGGATVNVTTQAFDVPVCGQNGADGSTVTTYTPTNFCVAPGDYVAFNDEGGFVPSNSGPPPYPAGVPYMVIGAAQGSTMDSFIRNNGVGNGATFSPSDATYHDGFASNSNEEVLLRATLATGRDATPLCPGGTAGVHHRVERALPPMRISPQTDGVNRSRVVSLAIYCRPVTGCQGKATLTGVIHGRSATFGGTHFNLRGNKTGRVRIRVSEEVIKLLRAQPGGVSATLTATFGSETFTQTVGLRIF